LIPYQSRRFVETGDPGHRLVGAGPLFVRRSDGRVEHLPPLSLPELEQLLRARFCGEP
jgi:hypothetical protein